MSDFNYSYKTKEMFEQFIERDKVMNAYPEIDEEIFNARKAGMTYGHYQQWKYQQQCRGKRG